MLVELKIDNILLMDNLQIEFADCFTAITGQTGAGKSVLLDSIGIILGKRAETSILRNNEKPGIIVATFKNNDAELNSLLYENGFLANENDNTIIIKKIITKNGSKILINEIQTTIQFVNSIAGKLLEIYSQFEQTDLFHIKKHLSILDKFSNLENDLKICKELYISMKNAIEQYNTTKNEIDRQKENIEYLQSFVKEMEALKLNDGEYDELLAIKKTMVDNEKIATYINNAYNLITNAKIGVIINKAQENLDRAVNNISENDSLSLTFKNINEALENLYTSSQIAEELISDFASKNTFDETKLNEIEERIFAINELARKYQTTPLELKKQHLLAIEKLKKISFSDEILNKLLNQVEIEKRKYNEFARSLSNKRKINAKKLEEVVINKLSNLKMEKVKFYTQFEESEASELGIDKVVFFASMNAGLTPAPIHKIASGGELSRFMLAFKSALCSVQNTSTIIFDEIDTGVSGSVAFAIGKEMQNLAKNAQVICITHNSQTASCAKEHLFVLKEQNLDIAKTVVKKLNQQERVVAIAEMISGEEITQEALNNATILLDKAKETE